MNKIEKAIVQQLKLDLQNPKLKADLQEFSSGGEGVHSRLQVETEVYVSCSALGMTWHCAVLKTADKRPEQKAA